MKPFATSAGSTAFCAYKLVGPCERFLWIDGNGKITAGNGTLERPRPNAFSLVEIADCPGATSVCRKLCYVHGLKTHAPTTHALYEHNSTTIREILADTNNLAIWARTMGEWINENCRGGFRWHVSGDLFSVYYVLFVRTVIGIACDVNHWIYTRSFDYAPLLAEVPNLAVNLSCDPDNYDHAVTVAGEYGFRLCYLTPDGQLPDDLPDGSVIFPDYGLRGGVETGQNWFAKLSPQYKSFVCPVDYHGKTESRRCGPCNRCLT